MAAGILTGGTTIAVVFDGSGVAGFVEGAACFGALSWVGLGAGGAFSTGFLVFFVGAVCAVVFFCLFLPLDPDR